MQEDKQKWKWWNLNVSRGLSRRMRWHTRKHTRTHIHDLLCFHIFHTSYTPTLCDIVFFQYFPVVEYLFAPWKNALEDQERLG